VTRWAADGKWIAYPVANGIDLITPDGTSTRKLSSRRFLAYSFSKDGSELYGIFQNATGRETNGNTAQWQLFSVDVKTGAERLLTPIEFPASVGAIHGFSIHPDGKRFLTSIDKFPRMSRLERSDETLRVVQRHLDRYLDTEVAAPKPRRR
jgi:hypothetical protein